jgi:hypothetical protein
VPSCSEPWRTILPLDAHIALLRQSGWHTEQTVDAVELDARATAGHTLLISARPDRAVGGGEADA